LVSFDAVASDTHRDLARAIGSVTCDLLRVGGRHRHGCDKQQYQGRQQLIHFAQTIKDGPGKLNPADYIDPLSLFDHRLRCRITPP
jgi:hypothetical protein